jgi:hypothetical protein
MYLNEKLWLRSRKPRLTQTIGTKIRRQAAVDQSVEFACGLKATEFVLYEALCKFCQSCQIMLLYDMGCTVIELRYF